MLLQSFLSPKWQKEKKPKVSMTEEMRNFKYAVVGRLIGLVPFLSTSISTPKMGGVTLIKEMEIMCLTLAVGTQSF